MSELKATKGPYVATGASVIFAEDGNEVARVDEDRESDEEVYTEHLMSASWDMYMALEPFANYACDEPCDCHNCIARDALAKARGES